MMKNLIILFCLAAVPMFAMAQDLGPGPIPDGATEFDRDPAAVPGLTKKRSFPGGADEEDLRVLAALPEAAMRIDARSLQREVYKQLYNQELKEETQNDLEE